MKGAVIVNAYYESESTRAQADAICREISRLDVDCEILKNSGAFCGVVDGVLQKPFNVDFCVYFDKDLYVLEALERSGIRVFNSLNAVRLCDDKMLTYLALSGVGIAMPDTVSGTFTYKNGFESSENELEIIEKRLGTYPYVVKLNCSSLGVGVYIAQNRVHLKEIISELSGKAYLVQKFIESSKGTDYRVILIGGKCFAAMKRESLTDFRSNIGLGGRGTAVELPRSYAELAERTAAILGLDYCGVDILSGRNGEPILCEVNSNAFFEGIEKATGKNVAKAYAEYIVSKLCANGKTVRRN